MGPPASYASKDINKVGDNLSQARRALDNNVSKVQARAREGKEPGFATDPPLAFHQGDKTFAYLINPPPAPASPSTSATAVKRETQPRGWRQARWSLVVMMLPPAIGSGLQCIADFRRLPSASADCADRTHEVRCARYVVLGPGSIVRMEWLV